MGSNIHKGKDASELPPFTENQLAYIQERAKGYTIMQSYMNAYNKDEPVHPSTAQQVENRPGVREAIQEAKDQAREAADISLEDQIASWKRLEHAAMQKGDIKTAMKALERIDLLCGFEAEATKNAQAQVVVQNLNHTTKAVTSVQEAPKELKGLVIDQQVMGDSELDDDDPVLVEGTTENKQMEVKALLEALIKADSLGGG